MPGWRSVENDDFVGERFDLFEDFGKRHSLINARYLQQSAQPVGGIFGDIRRTENAKSCIMPPMPPIPAIASCASSPPAAIRSLMLPFGSISIAERFVNPS